MKNFLFKFAVLAVVLASPSYAEKAQKTDPLSLCYKETANVMNDIHQAMSECLTNKLDDAKKIMDAAMGQEKASLEGIDSEQTAEAVENLAKSQVTFLAYRDAECERRASAMMGGTGSGSVLLACQVELNNWRAAQLSEQ